MRSGDWSSAVGSSDPPRRYAAEAESLGFCPLPLEPGTSKPSRLLQGARPTVLDQTVHYCTAPDGVRIAYACTDEGPPLVKTANWLNHLELDWSGPVWGRRSEEHPSELQSLMRISYAVFF